MAVRPARVGCAILAGMTAHFRASLVVNRIDLQRVLHAVEQSVRGRMTMPTVGLLEERQPRAAVVEVRRDLVAVLIGHARLLG